MGITTAQLPDDSVYIPLTLAVAEEIVDPLIQQVSQIMFNLATYNLAGDRLINFAQDVPDAPPLPGSNLPFFAATRAALKLNSFVSGVVSAASDEGTSETLLTIEAAKNFTLMDLQNLKTPYGLQYLGIAQTTGPSIWGLN